jgi:uncharacterized damage-inducible protein DinB
VWAPAAAQAAMAPAAPTSGFRAEFLGNFHFVNGKILKLAEAIPQQKYTWRPAPGVRSIAEVFLHIAQAQYLFGGNFGMKMPAGMDTAWEHSTTDKTKIIAALKAAFAAFDAAVAALPDGDAEKQVTLFKQSFTMRGLLLVETDHNAEHFGQMIAYARMNGVTPPWSMPGGGM